jgi:PleD family two-component response regulator
MTETKNISLPKPCILVVDDDIEMRELMRALLLKEEWNVMEAEDGEGAVKSFIENSPDLVLMDAIMPNINGYRACAQIKALPNGSNTPIVMVTTLDDSTAINNAFAAGADEYICKPVQPIAFRIRLRRILAKKLMVDQLITLNESLKQQLAERSNELERLTKEVESVSIHDTKNSDFSMINEEKNGQHSGSQMSHHTAENCEEGIAC